MKEIEGMSGLEILKLIKEIEDCIKSKDMCSGRIQLTDNHFVIDYWIRVVVQTKLIFSKRYLKYIL